MKKTVLRIFSILAALIFAVLSLCSCGASKASYDEANDVSLYSLQEEGKSADGFAAGISNDESVSESKAGDADGSSPTDIEDASARKLIRDAELEVETKDYDAFMTSLKKSVSAVKGYTESCDENGYSGYYSSRYANIVVRIPSEKFDSFLESLSGLATVTRKNVSVRDVTSQYIDTESHIKALETEQDALLGILAKANTVDEIITVQSRLSEVRAQLESYKSQLKNLENLVSYSTFTIFVNEVERVTPAEQEGFFSEIKSRLSENLYSLGQGFRSFAVWFISSIPYILIWAVVIAVVIVILKKIIKKRKARKSKKSEE